MIKKTDFEAYVKVQESGVTNMFDVRTVSSYSGLSVDQIVDIMKNYAQYNETYEH
jgi:hypothetical protein